MKEPATPPRLERFGPLAIAGLFRHHRLPREREDLSRAISAQWREFRALRRAKEASAEGVEYGIAMRMADGAKTFDYCCGIPIAGAPELARGQVRIDLPPILCAVFRHNAHPSRLRETLEFVFGTALPSAGLEPADEASDGPEFIERYDEHFDFQTGLGGFDVLVPVKE